MPAIRSGVFLRDLRCNAGNFCPRLLDGYARLQAGINIHIPETPVGQGMHFRINQKLRHHSREIKLRLNHRVDAFEVFRHNADDREVLHVDPNRLADDVGFPSEVSLPHAIADHRDRIAIGHFIFFGAENPAQNGLNSHEPEEIATDDKFERDTRVFAIAGFERRSVLPTRRQCLEHSCAFSKIIEVRI